tara:strand:+ start:104 stop:322 length:219 start_codon:yes stop_codon:yes gene_type:complete
MMKRLLSTVNFKKSEISKINEAYARIKSLQHWLNKTFPDTLPFEKPDLFKFESAEDFLVEEAKRWKKEKGAN